VIRRRHQLKSVGTVCDPLSSVLFCLTIDLSLRLSIRSRILSNRLQQLNLSTLRLYYTAVTKESVIRHQP